MPTEKFILMRKPTIGKQSGDKYPRIRTMPDAYDILVEWSVETGLPISELASRAIRYADKNKAYVEE